MEKTVEKTVEKAAEKAAEKAVGGVAGSAAESDFATGLNYDHRVDRRVVHRVDRRVVHRVDRRGDRRYCFARRHYAVVQRRHWPPSLGNNAQHAENNSQQPPGHRMSAHRAQVPGISRLPGRRCHGFFLAGRYFQSWSCDHHHLGGAHFHDDRAVVSSIGLASYFDLIHRARTIMSARSANSLWRFSSTSGTRYQPVRLNLGRQRDSLSHSR